MICRISTVLFTFLGLGVLSMIKAEALNDVQLVAVKGMPTIIRSTASYGEIAVIQISAPGPYTIGAKPGAVELLIRTLDAGTTHYTKEQIDQIFTSTGAVFSASSGGDYSEISLKCLKRFLPTLLPIVSEMIREPLLKPEEISLSRSQLEAELKGEQDHPDALLNFTMSNAFYKGHPYADRPSGYLETIGKVTRDDLLAARKKLFNTGNLLFTVIGDFLVADAQYLLTTHFGMLEGGDRNKMVVETLKNPTEIAFKKFESPTTYFMAKFKSPALKDADYPALTLATQILDNRLFEEVRTKRALTYAVSCGLGSANVNSGTLYVSSTKLEEAVKVIFDEVKKIQTELVDAETLSLQIRKFASNWQLNRETGSSQARIFSYYELVGPGWSMANSFIDRLSQVTPESMRDAAVKYMKDFTVAIVGPQKVDLTKIVPGVVEENAAPKAAGKSKAPKVATKAH